MKTVESSKAAVSVLKIGFVDYLYVFSNLPEAKKGQTELRSFEQQLKNQFEEKCKELQEKFEALQQLREMLTVAQQKQKEAELYKRQLAAKAFEYQQNIKMAERHKEVLQPIHDRIQEVINKIAAAHHYTFVLSETAETGAPIVCFADKAFDLSELVLEKMKAMAPEAVKTPVIGPKNNELAKVPAKPAEKVAATKKKK